MNSNISFLTSYSFRRVSMCAFERKIIEDLTTGKIWREIFSVRKVRYVDFRYTCNNKAIPTSKMRILVCTTITTFWWLLSLFHRHVCIFAIIGKSHQRKNKSCYTARVQKHFSRHDFRGKWDTNFRVTYVWIIWKNHVFAVHNRRTAVFESSCVCTARRSLNKHNRLFVFCIQDACVLYESICTHLLRFCSDLYLTFLFLFSFSITIDFAKAVLHLNGWDYFADDRIVFTT